MKRLKSMFRFMLISFLVIKCGEKSKKVDAPSQEASSEGNGQEVALIGIDEQLPGFDQAGVDLEVDTNAVLSNTGTVLPQFFGALHPDGPSAANVVQVLDDEPLTYTTMPRADGIFLKTYKHRNSGFGGGIQHGLNWVLRLTSADESPDYKGYQKAQYARTLDLPDGTKLHFVRYEADASTNPAFRVTDTRQPHMMLNNIMSDNENITLTDDAGNVYLFKVPTRDASADKARAWMRGVYNLALMRYFHESDSAAWRLEQEAPYKAYESYATRQTMAEFLVNAGHEALVKSLYLTYLRRPADAQGLKNWTDRLNAQTTIEEVIARLVAADEYCKTNEDCHVSQPVAVSNPAFVKKIYIDLLQRQVDPAGLQNWINRMAAGKTRFDVAWEIIRSDESISLFVKTTLDQIMAGNKPKDPSQDYFAMLKAGNRREKIVAAILASKDYYNLTARTLPVWLSGIRFNDGTEVEISRPLNDDKISEIKYPFGKTVNFTYDGNYIKSIVRKQKSATTNDSQTIGSKLLGYRDVKGTAGKCLTTLYDESVTKPQSDPFIRAHRNQRTDLNYAANLPDCLLVKTSDPLGKTTSYYYWGAVDGVFYPLRSIVDHLRFATNFFYSVNTTETETAMGRSAYIFGERHQNSEGSSFAYLTQVSSDGGGADKTTMVYMRELNSPYRVHTVYNDASGYIGTNISYWGNTHRVRSFTDERGIKTEVTYKKIDGTLADGFGMDGNVASVAVSVNNATVVSTSYTWTTAVTRNGAVAYLPALVDTNQDKTKFEYDAYGQLTGVYKAPRGVDISAGVKVATYAYNTQAAFRLISNSRDELTGMGVSYNYSPTSLGVGIPTTVTSGLGLSETFQYHPDLSVKEIQHGGYNNQRRTTFGYAMTDAGTSTGDNGVMRQTEFVSGTSWDVLANSVTYNKTGEGITNYNLLGIVDIGATVSESVLGATSDSKLTRNCDCSDSSYQSEKYYLNPISVTPAPLPPKPGDSTSTPPNPTPTPLPTRMPPSGQTPPN